MDLLKQQLRRQRHREYMREHMRMIRAGAIEPRTDEDDLPIAPGPRPKRYRDYMREERRKNSIHTKFDEMFTRLYRENRIYGCPFPV